MSEPTTDPVCGMQIKPSEAAATASHDGRTFYFCSPSCHRAFMTTPARFAHPRDVTESSVPARQPTAG